MIKNDIKELLNADDLPENITKLLEHLYRVEEEIVAAKDVPITLRNNNEEHLLKLLKNKRDVVAKNKSLKIYTPYDETELECFFLNRSGGISTTFYARYQNIDIDNVPETVLLDLASIYLVYLGYRVDKRAMVSNLTWKVALGKISELQEEWSEIKKCFTEYAKITSGKTKIDEEEIIEDFKSLVKLLTTFDDKYLIRKTTSTPKESIKDIHSLIKNPRLDIIVSHNGKIVIANLDKIENITKIRKATSALMSTLDISIKDYPSLWISLAAYGALPVRKLKEKLIKDYK